MSASLHAKCYSYPVLRKIGMYIQILVKLPDIGFHDKPSGESRVAPYEQMDRQKDLGTDRCGVSGSRFSQLMNAPEKILHLLKCWSVTCNHNFIGYF
jgi:hypothetical protein